MSRYILHCLAGASVFGLAAAVTPAARAQSVAQPEVGPEAQVENGSGGGLEEIIVTAQKRSEKLQSVPISVTAVTGGAIEKLHGATIEALQGSVPNVQISSFANTPSTAVFNIRGIGVIDADPYAGNTVSIVLDGVPQVFAIGALVNIYDIDRVEILRGPQGTLFGANTTGGVVNIVSQAPDNDLSAKGELSFGNYSRIEAKGVLNAPLTDTLSSRFSVSHMEHDGYVTNVVNGSDMGRRNVSLYRGQLRWQATDNFDATLLGEYALSRNGAPVVINGAYPGEPLYVAPGTQGMYASICSAPTVPCAAPDRYLSANDSVPDRSDMDTYRSVLTLNWKGTALGDITSVTGYKKNKLTEFTDQDATPVFLADTGRHADLWQFTQELRSSFDMGDRARAIVGAFFVKDHYDLSNAFRVAFAAPGLIQINTQDQDNHSISGFAQTYVDLTDTLRAQAGIRFTHERTRMNAATVTSINASGVTDFEATGNTVLQTVVGNGEKTWNNVGWKLGLDWKVQPDMLLYGYWARGFKSGGFVGRVGLPSDIGPFNPEFVDTLEAGLKTDLFDRHLRVNLSGFYTIYRDLQVAQIYVTKNPDTGLPLQGNTIQNAGKAEIKGFELEVSANPIHGLTLNGSLAFLDARYKNFPYVDPLTLKLVDLAGYRLQNAPKWSATAGFNYRAEIGDNVVSFSASYRYTGQKYLTAILDTPRASIQPTHIVDASIDWTLPDDRFTIGFWAKNLLDNRYIDSIYDAPGYSGLGSFAPPREYGITTKVRL
ncbi:TonB-dependent receptor [Novosphingobium sp. KCTC 2891]|uniref:TonB-dependent receptor n=1 Tax=Novosphingobium sp. KCTC 2891 TaxID=2989730 RepID=UPI002223724A|nr:TonB-dependent receptor [Novosphingobium sp. KCTC 2891]MCW1383802.1 TonB-dependent receptor [Novosphingobium sp. KCTC 2891]